MLMTNLLTTHPYEHNVVTVKKLGENHVKITQQNTVRKSGWEQEAKPKRKRGTASDRKQPCNVSRACSTVEELAMNNNWDWFCTFTIDGNKMDRYDLIAYLTAFKAFLQEKNKKLGKYKKIRYVYVPAPHEDGAWHIHGVFRNIPRNEICPFGTAFCWSAYEEKFGISEVKRIYKIEGCVWYMHKAMRETANYIQGLNVHLFYSSRKLRRAEKIYKKSDVNLENVNWDFENEHCKGKILDLREESVEDFLFGSSDENHTDNIS